MRKRRVMKVREKRTFQMPPYMRKVLVCCCGCIIALILIYAVFVAYTLLTMHTTSLTGSTSTIPTNIHVNILLADLEKNNVLTNICILSIDKSSATIIPLPNNLIIPDNGNPVLLKTVYAIDQLQSQKGAISEITSLLEENTYIPISAYLFVKPGTQDFSEMFNLSQAHISLSKVGGWWVIEHASTLHLFLSNDIYTNLSAQSIYSIGSTLSSLGQVSVLTPSSSDFSQVTAGVEISMSNFVSDITANITDGYITSENARISVYNGTNTSGEGQYIANILQNQGAIIDQVGTAKSTISRSVVYSTDSNKYPNTLKKLETMFHAVLVKRSYDPTSDFAIVLGSDMVAYF
jgi:hypothetical protein